MVVANVYWASITWGMVLSDLHALTNFTLFREVGTIINQILTWRRLAQRGVPCPGLRVRKWQNQDAVQASTLQRHTCNHYATSLCNRFLLDVDVAFLGWGRGMKKQGGGVLKQWSWQWGPRMLLFLTLRDLWHEPGWVAFLKVLCLGLCLGRCGRTGWGGRNRKPRKF